MTKLEALNALPVSDWSCSCGELEYVVTKNTEEARGLLLGSGFSASEIEEACENEPNDIDLSVLAFNYTDADYWTKQSGFMSFDADSLLGDTGEENSQ